MKKVEKRKISSYIVMGIEFKLRRIQLGMGLAEVAYGLCSISYLSKIENNKINGNSEILRKIALRLKLSDERLNALLNSDVYLIDAALAYARNDQKKLDECYQTAGTLENYRSKIINMIYCVYHHNSSRARRIIKEIDKIGIDISNDDEYIYNLFKAIYYFEESNLVLSKQIALDLEEYDFDIKEIINENKKLLSKIEYKTNGVNFKEYIVQLKDFHLNSLNFNECKGDYELENSFELRNFLIRKINGLYFSNDDKSVLNSLKEIVARELKRENPSDFFKIYSRIINFEEIDGGYTGNDYEYILDRYLYEYYFYSITLPLEGKLDYLENICLKKAYELNDLLYIVVYKNLLLNLLEETGKYKKMMKIEKEYNEYNARWI